MKVKESMFITVLIGIARLSSGLWQSCIHNPIDVVFVLDGSGSVGPNRFGLFKLFVQKLVLQLNVGENGTRVAVMQLGDIKETKFEFGINNHSDVSTLLLAIENIKYQYGRLQKTEIALRLAETEVFNDQDTTDRPWAKNVVVLIAEGPSTYPVTNVLQEANHLKKSGVQLVAIGVGRRISLPEFQNELNSVASSPRDVLFASDDEILNLVDHLDGTLCPNITATSSVQSSSDATKLAATPVPAKVITSVLVKTMTIWMTSYVAAPAICKTSIATTKSSFIKTTPTSSIVNQLEVPTVVEKEEEEKKRKKTFRKVFSGKLLKCFTCNYDDEVAKEFSIACERLECAPGETYCADAILEHAGRKFVRKRCATGQFCNSTAKQCVGEFQHTAEYTDCSVTCCADEFCNPYSHASYIIASVYMKFLLAFVVLLVRLIADNH